MITQDKLKHLLEYNKDSGDFIWIRPYKNQISKGDIAGFINDRGYLMIGIGGKSYRAHRLAFLYMEGSMPPNQVDHINHNRSDNRWCNLRHSTYAANNKNASIRKRNKSGCTGVHWDNNNSKWCSKITSNGNTIHLGVYDDIEDAIRVRKEAERAHGFHENHGT